VGKKEKDNERERERERRRERRETLWQHLSKLPQGRVTSFLGLGQDSHVAIEQLRTLQNFHQVQSQPRQADSCHATESNCGKGKSPLQPAARRHCQLVKEAGLTKVSGS
jgi:hypothetical protein